MTRQDYAEYIGECIRCAAKETGLLFPLDTVIVVQSWSELANYTDLLGFKIIICNFPSPFEFFVGFPSTEPIRKVDRLSRWFLEYLNIIPMKQDK